MMHFPSRTGPNITVMEEGKLLRGWNTKHLTTRTRPAQILRRNTGLNIFWPHVMRKGRKLYDS